LINRVFFSERRLGVIGIDLGNYGAATESAPEYMTLISPLDGVRKRETVLRRVRNDKPARSP
jgi:hypothetical protein